MAYISRKISSQELIKELARRKEQARSLDKRLLALQAEQAKLLSRREKYWEGPINEAKQIRPNFNPRDGKPSNRNKVYDLVKNSKSPVSPEIITKELGIGRNAARQILLKGYGDGYYQRVDRGMYTLNKKRSLV